MVLTKRQKEVLEYIEDYVGKNGFSPSYDDIAAHFGFSSKGTVYRHIHTLEKKGKLTTSKNKSRSITLHAGGERIYEVPVIGTVSRKQGLKRYRIPDYLRLPEHFDCRNDDMIYMVEDSSFREEYILKRDFLLLSKEYDTAKPFYCLVQVDGKDYFIKYFHLENNIIRLNSTNVDLLPLFYEPNRIRIVGRIAAVIREF